MLYTIVDIETTGRGNKITEISIFKYDGIQVIEEYTSLVNPEALIPPDITALTGIDDVMVADAPTFREIAHKVLDITAGCIFVAHSVNFDYNVIRNECKAIGLDFRRPKLCTVRLSRRLFPGLRSYGLGKLCQSRHIIIKDRHRARGDAEATVELFRQLLVADHSGTVIKEFLKKSSKEATLPPHLSTQVFDDIPNAPGIYLFKDKKGKVIYVGKAKDLKKRVLGHFYTKSQKELNLCRETANIDYELSGSELIALLMEDAAIKHYYPKYNEAAKRKPVSYSIFSYEDRKGILHLAYNRERSVVTPLLNFYSITECRQFLEALCMQFELCPKYCHLQEGVAHCSHYKIDLCHGVCRDDESVELYNNRVRKALEHAIESANDVVIRQQGRHEDEEAFVLVKNGLYLGYGFIDRSEQIVHEDELENFIIPQNNNIDVQRVLRKYITI